MSGRLRNKLLSGDVLDRVHTIPDHSVDLVVTSPPYFRLREYDAAGQLGGEPTVTAWVDNLASVAREIARVLTATGSLWLNLGDSYSVHPRQGAPRKSLLLGPERLLLQLRVDGWIVRNKIVWAKPNPMPHPVRDRLSTTWEVIYLLTRTPRSYFDLDAIRQPHRSRSTAVRTPAAGSSDRRTERWRGPNAAGTGGLAALQASGRVGHPLGKNPGDVWTMASSGYRGHHATFPLALADRIIRAACPEARCIRCQVPWRRPLQMLGETAVRGALGPGCECRAPTEPGLVLDPFMGSGTTAVAAEQAGRDWLGIELNPDYAALAKKRIQAARGSPATAPAA